MQRNQGERREGSGEASIRYPDFGFLRSDGIDITVNKLDVMAKSTMDRFGVVRTPALVVNGSIKIMGKVPDPGVIERIVRKEL